MLVLLLVVLSAAGVALWADDAEQASLDERFTVETRHNSFANATYFGAVKVRGRRIDVDLDSLRVSAYKPALWNELEVRAVLRGPDRAHVDTTRYQRLPTDSTIETSEDGTVVINELPRMTLRVPRGTAVADHRIVLEISTMRSALGGGRSWNPALLDSLLLRRAVIGNP